MLNTGKTPEELMAIIGEYDGLAVRSACKPDKDVIAAGDITITTVDAAGSGQWIRVEAGRLIQSTTGSIYLRAGDDVDLDSGVQYMRLPAPSLQASVCFAINFYYNCAPCYFSIEGDLCADTSATSAWAKSPLISSRSKIFS